MPSFAGPGAVAALPCLPCPCVALLSALSHTCFDRHRFHDAGLAPDTIARVYHAKQQEAQGLFQVFYHARPAHALRHLSLVIWLLYSAQAFSNQWAALLMPVWLAVPLVQVIFDVFPFNPNRYAVIRHCRSGQRDNRAVCGVLCCIISMLQRCMRS